MILKLMDLMLPIVQNQEVTQLSFIQRCVFIVAVSSPPVSYYSKTLPMETETKDFDEIYTYLDVT